MLEEMQTVIATKLPLYRILVPDAAIFPVTANRVLIHVGMVTDTNVRFKELRGKLLIYTTRNPTLSEVKIKVTKRNVSSI